MHERFKEKLCTMPELTSKLASYRGNYDAPGFRWMKYREGFSKELVELLIESVQPLSVLDPFSGIGTTSLVATGRGLQATGIEILPVGALTGKAISIAANGLQLKVFTAAAACLLERIAADKEACSEHAFPHVRITEAAFPAETESALAKAREFLASIEDAEIHAVLNLACMSVLEAVSYTRKDGQYLRWDYRSGKSVRSRLRKQLIEKFPDALRGRLEEMVEDIEELKKQYGNGVPKFITGSCLDHLRQIPCDSFDMVITSPPYANRYDYTRTYALELAWLGYDHQAFKTLRQAMLSATVENKSKRQWLTDTYIDSGPLKSATAMYEQQGAVHEVIARLKECLNELNNPHVIRMLEGYFFEMALIVVELGRIVQPGGTVVMVNDNVQYHGEELPVDFILSDYAEQSGFTCEKIYVLPRQKGNSSQQMKRYGRRQQRKCIYWWVRHSDLPMVSKVDTDLEKLQKSKHMQVI